jgi:predicted RNA-binding Zn ribbon-like protein
MRTWSFRSWDDPTPASLGGRLCLAFVNSVQWRRSAQPDDLMPDYPAMVGYLHRVGLVDDREREALRAGQPGPARRAHAGAIALREALFRLLSAVAGGTSPAPADLATLTETLHAGMARFRLAEGNGGVVGDWSAASLEWPLWDVAASAAALLLEGEQARLKQCPGERCGWLFIDRSRNHSRRWCDSTICGNRDRARRFYQQHAHG